MTYTAKTFSAERYTLWNVRADWHNLPMVGDDMQREGAAHAARNVVCTPDGLELNLEAAYDDAAGLLELKRSFALDADGLRLTDEGLLRTAREITWIFLLRQKPVWKAGRIIAGNLEIRCPNGLSFRAEEKPVTDERMARNWPGSLWRVMLRSKAAERFSMRFVFSAGNREG